VFETRSEIRKPWQRWEKCKS